MSLQTRKLDLFKRASQKIPAYKAFLEEKDFNPLEVENPIDLVNLPFTNKDNYLKKYKLNDLLWPDAEVESLMFCATSGSTGEPYYFPRDERLSEQYSTIAERYLLASSYGRTPTLMLVGFGMGVWIGGVITQRAFEIAANRIHYPLSILPTGYNKVEIFKALKKLAPKFDQTIIVGYPPFVKEIVDEASVEGIDLTKLNIRFFFAAEAFTETFRNYLCDRVGIKDPSRDTLNIYGSADIGAMASETPLSILIRQLALSDPLLYMDVFGQIEKTPTLAQFDPEHIIFEEKNGELLITGDNIMPLINYAIGDHGGVFEFDQIKSLMSKYNIDLEKSIKDSKLESYIDRKLPFVYVYERIDLSVTLHGLNIYPEFIKEALIGEETSKVFTEKFTMATKTDIHHNQFLLINIEIKKGIETTEEFRALAYNAIKDSLIEKSSEFAEVAKSKLASSLIKIELWPNGHPRYFAPGTKQKWVEKA